MMLPLSVRYAAVALVAVLSYFAGRARGIEWAGRRWLAVFKRSETAWTSCYRANHNMHVEIERALLAGIDLSKTLLEQLRARLDQTAIPEKRN